MWEKEIFEKGKRNEKEKKGPTIGKGKAKERPKLLSFATLFRTIQRYFFQIFSFRKLQVKKRFRNHFYHSRVSSF